MRRLRLGLGVAVAVIGFAVTSGAAQARTYYDGVPASFSSTGGVWDLFITPAGVVSGNDCGAACDNAEGTLFHDGSHIYTAGSGWGCGGLETCETQVTSVNGVGQLSGFTQPNGSNVHRAFREDSRTGAFSLLAGPSEGYFMNADGQLFGAYWNAAGKERAFLSTSGSTRTDLGTLGGTEAVAYGSAGLNQAVGCSRVASGAWHPFLYQRGAMVDLGLPSGAPEACAVSINQNNQILTTGMTPTTTPGCGLWLRSSTGNYTAIQPPSGRTCITGNHVDLNGRVGLSAPWSGNLHPQGYVWQAGALTKITPANFPFDANALPDIGTNPWVTSIDSTNLHGQLAALVEGNGLDQEIGVLLTPMKIYDETNAALTYTGTWTRTAKTGAWGGYIKRSTAAGSKVKLTFTGRRVRIVGLTAPNLGSANVTLDGGGSAVIDENDPYATTTRATVFRYTWPTAGVHTITITANGAFAVDALTTTRY
jgi:probable HAF family extracellular repeat protein